MRSWFLLASALVGIGSLHQAMHRMDPGHLLQVVPAAIICASLIASGLLSGALSLSFPARAKPWVRLAGVVYATLVVVIGLKLARWGQVDLAPFSPWPLERYSGLAHPLGHFDRDPRVAALSTVAKLTNPGEPILVFPRSSATVLCTHAATHQRPANCLLRRSLRLAAGLQSATLGGDPGGNA